MSQEDQTHRPPPPTVAPFDLGPLQGRLGDDRKAAEAVLSAFAGDAPRQIAKLREAVSAGASEQVRLLAHTLKGSLLWIGADEVAAIAHTIELNPSANSPIALGTALLNLSTELERLLLAVKSQLGAAPR